MRQLSVHPILVNRNRSLKTLRDKAELTGFRFTKPSPLPEGFKPFTVLDVDGTAHDTIIKWHDNKKPTIGVYDGTLAGKYHGKLSRNWQAEQHTADGIVEILNAGYSVAPGLFDNPPDKSHRSGNYRAWTDVILFDGDEWTDEHPAPESIDALIERYPTLPEHFYWVGESISSRSTLKPYLNMRLMMILPEPIHRDDPWTWNAMVEWVTDLYPFVAAGVASDKVRLSFGNARPDRSERRFGKRLDIETLNIFRQRGAKALADHTLARLGKAKQKTNQTQRSEYSEKITADLRAKGIVIPDTKEPISTFNETDIETILIGLGCERVKGDDWHWPESGPGKSFTLHLGSPPVIECYSNSIKAHNPNADDTDPVEAHRLVAYYLYGLDMSKDSDKAELRERLAADGYGTPTAEFRQIQELKRNATNGTPRAKLTKTETESDTESITLTESEQQREDAAKTFIEKPGTPELLQIQAVQDDTGTGKTTTALIITAKAKQKTVALAETVPLAHQLETDAMDKGFVNTITLQSRKTGWKDLDDDAETEFGEVLCKWYPKTKEYTDLRLPARHLCETKCPDYDECKEFWYLNQFVDIDERDFIATASPNLFFDLHMRGFLETLTDTHDMYDDESEISLAFDAMTDSPVKSESTDGSEDTEDSENTEDSEVVGIIDDYTISSLFTDVVWTEKELERVKEAWQGTPTARFVGKVLKALKKRKPQKIMKTLRKAYNQTAEDHKEIADTLTQHARHGTIISASLPKLSELAHNAVEYTDGGKQFIPVENYQPSHEQVMALAKKLPSVEEKPLDETIKKSGAYSDVRLERIRTDYARRRLNAERIPCVPTSLDAKDLQPGEKVIVPHPFNEALAAGVKLNDLTPVWQNGCTPIDLLKILLGYVKQDKNAPVNIRYKLSKETEKPTSVLSFSIPPQAPVGIIKKLIMLSATVDTDDLEKVFTGQPTEIDKHIGKRIKLANDVGICQFADARITSGSVFEYNTDENGNRIKKPAGLTKKASERLAKLNNYANQVDGLTVFISYKDLAEDFRAHLDNFDEVSSFDKVAGLNFNGLKLLVVFGYPKVSHEVVMAEARKQYANDTDPLPRGEKELYDEHGNLVSEYIQLTEECEYNDDGLVIKERRYKNHRLEKIRIQLSADKLRQCVGRARLVRWTGTLSLIFTNTPLPGITDRAELFGNDAFNAAESASDLPAAQKRITDAIESGDVKAVMEATGKSESTARRKTKETRDQKNAERDAEIIRLHEKGLSQRKIHTEMQASEHKISFGTVGNVIKAYKNSHSLKVTLKGDDRFCTPNEKTDDTSVPSVLPEKDAAAAKKVETVPEPQNSDPKPIPLSEYSSLDDETALLELERCKKRSNYSGASFLGNLLRKRGISDKQPVEKVDTKETMLNLFDWDIKTLYLRREEIATHTDVSKLIPKNHRLRNLADDEVLRVDSNSGAITELSIVNRSHIFEFTEVFVPLGDSDHQQYYKR